MLSKCSNPKCSSVFLYLHEGKLFRYETADRSHGDSNGGFKKSMGRMEYFWLCDDCASQMTLTFKDGEGVAIRRMARAQAVGL